MAESNPQPNPENPERFTGLKETAIPDTAAGIPAVVSAVKHVLKEMDPVRGLKALAAVNQKKGFDCPGCAWPDPDDERSAVAEYCENGAKAIAEEATSKRLDAAFFKKHSIAELSELDDYEIGKKGRIAQPLFKAKGDTHYRAISWDAAFKHIATHLNRCDSPDEAVFYTSGRTSNEAAFLYQLFVREYGTNNLPDCSNMCHESSGVALSETLGLGKGSVTLDDFNHAEAIIILGQNPGTNHPRMLSALQKAHDKGCVIISVNPLAEAGLSGFNNPQTVRGVLGLKAKLSDYHLPVKINGDMPLLKAIAKVWLEKEKNQPGSVFDLPFIQKYTMGVEAFKNSLDQYDLESLAQHSGISLEDIRNIADVLASKKRIIACWAMGLTQHKNAVATIQDVVNLLLLKGSIGKQGAGTCPVRGHSNVQGDRTMGIYEKPSAAFLDSIERVFRFSPPRHPGFDVVESIQAMRDRKVKVFFCMGGNFLSASPDTLATAQGLQNCPLTVQVSTKLNRSHLITGEEALILPVYGRSDRDLTGGKEQFISCENSMGVVQKSQGSLKPISDQLKSEVEIVCRMAMATLGAKSKVYWEAYIHDYDAIRDDIEKAIPGFSNYNQRVRDPGGFYLPNGPRERQFLTESKKARFTTSVFEPEILDKDELVMMTIRSHDQFNTTIYGLDDRYRGIRNERRVLMMNADDMAERGIQHGDVIDITSYFQGEERRARKFIAISYAIPKGCAASYFPETNVLVPLHSVAEKSNTPTSKFVRIRVFQHQDQALEV